MSKFSLKVDKCKGCGLSMRACPKQLLSPGMRNNAQGVKYPVLKNEAECISCASCALTCPDMCITIYREA